MRIQERTLDPKRPSVVLVGLWLACGCGPFIPPVPEVVRTDADPGGALWVDSEGIVLSGPFEMNGATLTRIAFADGATSIVGAEFLDPVGPEVFALLGNDVFFLGTVNGKRGAYKRPVGGGDATLLLETTDPRWLRGDGANVWVHEYGGVSAGVHRFGADGSHAFASNGQPFAVVAGGRAVGWSGDFVEAASFDGSEVPAPFLLQPVRFGIAAMFAGEAGLFYVTEEGVDGTLLHGLLRAPLSGGVGRAVLPTGDLRIPGNSGALASDGVSVVWFATSGSNGAFGLLRVDLVTGAQLEVRLEENAGAGAMAIGGGFLWWIDGRGRLMRVPR